MHADFEFAWIHYPDASPAILTYDDVHCTVFYCVFVGEKQ